MEEKYFDKVLNELEFLEKLVGKYNQLLINYKKEFIEDNEKTEKNHVWVANSERAKTLQMGKMVRRYTKEFEDLIYKR